MSRHRLLRIGVTIGAAVALGVVVACGDDAGAPAADLPGIERSMADASASDAVDASSGVTFAVEQTWYLERDATTTGDAIEWTRKEGSRATLTIGHSAAGALVGRLEDDDGATDVEAIDATTERLAFRWRAKGGWQHYRMRTTDGVAVGRWTTTASADPPALTSFGGHVTGWNAEAFPLSGRALSWDVELGNGARARIRIARDDANAWIGRFEVYAGPEGEGLEQDASSVSFDGVKLSLITPQTSIVAKAEGRTLTGNATANGASSSLKGVRSALASYGIAARGDRAAWQAVTRHRLKALMMDGAPPPKTPCTPYILDGPMDPTPASGPMPVERDDDFAAHPRDYEVQSFSLICEMTNPFDGRPITASRWIHGFVARPNAAAPPGGYPVVMAINGHGGGSASVLKEDDPLFHYGDAYARRGFLVVAIDVKHHPDEAILGEPGTNPPIVGDGFTTSDWEEDGERVWDLVQATDYVLGRNDVDPSRTVVTGLSMGGEETTLLAALDERWKMAIPAGYGPDMDVLLSLGGHNCWQWKNADIREWIDQSDLHALIAPRALLVETGRQDFVYSARKPPFSGDLQVMRRTRVASTEAEQARVALYLHHDVHAYHFGDRRAADAVGLGVLVAPAATTSPTWQTDETTTTLAPSLFDVIDTWLP